MFQKMQVKLNLINSYDVLLFSFTITKSLDLARNEDFGPSVNVLGYKFGNKKAPNSYVLFGANFYALKPVSFLQEGNHTF